MTTSPASWTQNLLRALHIVGEKRSTPTTPDDAEFADAMRELRTLARSVETLARPGANATEPFPRILTTTLELALHLVHDDTAWSDDAGAALAEMRNEKLMREAA